MCTNGECAGIFTGCRSEKSKVKNGISLIPLENRDMKMCIPFMRTDPGEVLEHAHNEIQSSLAWQNTSLETAHLSTGEWNFLTGWYAHGMEY